MTHGSNENEDKNLKDIMSSQIIDDALVPFLLVRTMCGRKISQVIENHSSCFSIEIFIAAMLKENLTHDLMKLEKSI